MKSKTYTQSKRPLDKNQSSKFCQSGVKQTHFQNLKEKRKWFFLSQGHFKRKVHTSRFFRKDTKKNKQFHRATANSYHSTVKFTTEIHIFYFFHRIQGHSTLGVCTHLKPTETLQFTEFMHFTSRHPLEVRKGFFKG